MRCEVICPPRHVLHVRFLEATAQASEVEMKHPTLNVEEENGKTLLVADYGDWQYVLGEFYGQEEAEVYKAAVAHSMLYAREVGRMSVG